MQIPQQYYGAEMQDVSVLVNLDRGVLGRRTYVFAQKVLADTYYVKFTQPSNQRITPISIATQLTYTPIVLQSARGGPTVADILTFVKNDNPGFIVEYDGDAYDTNNIIKITPITDVSSNPAGNVTEVTAKFSLVLSYPEIKMTGTFIS